MAKAKKKKKQGVDCSECAVCCTYLNIVVERPNDVEDVETLLSYIYHKNADLCLDEDGDWSVVFHNRCKQLDKNNLCKIYERRPYICRNFSEKNCHGDDFSESVKKHFSDEKDLMDYLGKRRPALYRKFRNAYSVR